MSVPDDEERAAPGRGWPPAAWLRSRGAQRAGAVLGLGALFAGAAVVMLRDDPDRNRLATLNPSVATAASPAPIWGPDRSASPPHDASASLPVPPVLDRATGARLLVVQGTRLEILDVDSGRTEVLASDPRLTGYERLDVLPVDGELVLLGDNSTGAGNVPSAVLATTAGAGSPLRQIGTAARLARSSTPRRLWLSVPHDGEVPSVTFEEVDLDGRVHRRVVLRKTFYAEPFAEGFLRYDEIGSGVELVDGRGSVLRSFPGMRLLRVDPRTAVLVDGPVCDVRCDALVLRADPKLPLHRVEVAQVVGETSAEGAVAQDGATLWTARAWEPHTVGGSVHRTDLQTGQPVPVAGASAQTYWGFDPAFTPDGRWVFWPDADDDHVNAYDVSRGAASRVPGDFRGITSVVVLPAG
jgi:hypothetical protein